MPVNTNLTLSRIVQRTRSPSPEPKLESPPSLPIHGVSSPVLSALVDDDDAGFDTRAWARNIPYGVSPPNIAASPRDSPANNPALIGGFGTSPSGPAFSLAGSPPNAHDRFRPAPSEDLRGAFGAPSPALSPRAQTRLPSKQASDMPPVVSPRGRPLSMPSNYIPPSAPAQRPQAHLRQVSEAEIGLTHSRSTSNMRDNQDLVVFDNAYYDGNLGDVIVAGSTTAVYIYKLERERLTILGTLTGLRGSILAARMLPPSEGETIEPMVAVIIHGPTVLQSEDPSRPSVSKNEVQTSVEVYAISEGKHLGTLYRTPPATRSQYIRLTNPSHAIGALTLHVAGRFITVTSGISGEVYIFEAKKQHDEVEFVCLGKIWTSMPNNRQRSYSMSSTSSAATSRDESPMTQAAQDMGIISLSQRWLAYVPPTASSQTSLQGDIGVGFHSREPPGLMSHTSPAQPSPNCEAETPLEDPFLTKVARDSIQEVTKGTRWAAQQSYNVVKSYWTKADAQSPPDMNSANLGYGQQQAAFPPTHAQENASRWKPAQTCVSIVDLERLSESHSGRQEQMIHPSATFPLRNGCRFISFNPTGLSLFTANAKGDVSYVWCLMRIMHGSIATPSGDVAAADSHASVRQIARYGRMTESNIVDVVWTKPRGEKFAILTDKGTVHIHDLPASAFRWPPPARHTSPASTPGLASETSSQQSQSKGRFGGAVSWMTNTAQNLQTVAKNRPPITGSSLGGLAYAGGAKASRIVGSTVSRSVGAVSGMASNVIHSGENRTRLPGESKARVVAGAVSLLSSKYQDALAITGGGLVRIHAIRLSVTDGGKGKRSVAGEQISQLDVANIDGADHVPGQSPTGLTVRGQWFADTKSHGFRPNQTQPQPLSHAEIETSTPYRPFHNDHRVTMNTYANDAVFDRETMEDWEFGEEFETVDVGDEDLPAGSMHLNKHDADLDFEDADASEDEPPLPPSPPRPAAKTIRSVKKSKKTKQTESKNEDLIDVFDGGALDRAPARQKARAPDPYDELEDDEGLPFGQTSEFGMMD